MTIGIGAGLVQPNAKVPKGSELWVLVGPPTTGRVASFSAIVKDMASSFAQFAVAIYIFPLLYFTIFIDIHRYGGSRYDRKNSRLDVFGRRFFPLAYIHD